MRYCRKRQLSRIPEKRQEPEEIFGKSMGESLGICQAKRGRQFCRELTGWKFCAESDPYGEEQLLGVSRLCHGIFRARGPSTDVIRRFGRVSVFLIVVTLCSWILISKQRRICDEKIYSASVSDINIMTYIRWLCLYTVKVSYCHPSSGFIATACYKWL